MVVVAKYSIQCTPKRSAIGKKYKYEQETCKEMQKKWINNWKMWEQGDDHFVDVNTFSCVISLCVTSLMFLWKKWN